MSRRPNVLFLMADQHHAGSMSCAGHPNVHTPHLDRIAARGVRFSRAYCNNPICGPSRVSFATGQYCHTHRLLGNNNFERDDHNPATLAACFRRQGYQTALVGKAHMVRAWDREGYEHVRYCDLCDADRADPREHHYFKYLIDHGLADQYEDGGLPRGHPANTAWCAVAELPYEHSVEHWTGEESLGFLRDRDRSRPFLLQMSFERPHPHWMPAAEYADLYNPGEIVLGASAADWFENHWQGRPEHIMRSVCDLMRGLTRDDIKKALAHHFALITCIDMEIGRVLDFLESDGELDDTIIVYAADHGDFAGDHGLIMKNIGIYESIHRIPFLVAWPGGPRNEVREGIVESVDLFPTLCELARVPSPNTVDGRSILPELMGEGEGKDRAICEWDFVSPQRFVNAIRTRRHRLVYYSHELGGELYDHDMDPDEMHNLYDDPAYASVRLALFEQLYDEVNRYQRKSDFDTDREIEEAGAFSPTHLVHKRCGKWSEMIRLYGVE